MIGYHFCKVFIYVFKIKFNTEFELTDKKENRWPNIQGPSLFTKGKLTENISFQIEIII